MRTTSVWTIVAARRLAPIDVVGPALPEGRGERVAAADGVARMTVRVDAEEQGGAGSVGDPGARDVPNARPRRPRSRHHHPHPGTIEERAQPQRHGEHEVGLANPGHDAVRASAVLDLARGRARSDRLGGRVCALVVPWVDDDHESAGRVGAAGKDERREDREEPTRADHGGGPTRILIHTNVRITPGTKRIAEARMSAFAAVDSRSTARPATMHKPASTQSAVPIAPTPTSGG